MEIKLINHQGVSIEVIEDMTMGREKEMIGWLGRQEKLMHSGGTLKCWPKDVMERGLTS